MNYQIVKIYNTNDFNQITNGIKVAQFMSLKSSILDTEKVVSHFEDLVVSNSLCCSYCNTVFEDKNRQRTHYKLDWHRFNLKQHLHGLKSVSEDIFKIMINKNVSNMLHYEDMQYKDDCISLQCNENKKVKKKFIKQKTLDYRSNSSDEDYIEDYHFMNTSDELASFGSRHSKVFFENEKGNIFSIYRCLLHNKKEIPEVDTEIIAQALQSGKKSMWTIIMVGGGHFAAGVFTDGDVIVHKTIQYYTIRSKQGFVQNSRDNRQSLGFLKNAGATIRRQNELKLAQEVQKIIASWSSYIQKSSLVFYRAVGPRNRTLLFGGKTSLLDKTDPRLRPLPFPTRKATFNEVKRAYDVLSNVEIYGSEDDLRKTFLTSDGQMCRKKSLKSLESCNETGNQKSNRNKITDLLMDKKCRNSRTHIDRAKPRRSPHRPLPDIVAKLAQSSSESDLEIQDYTFLRTNNVNIIEHESKINLENCLQPFENTALLLKKKYILKKC